MEGNRGRFLGDDYDPFSDRDRLNETNPILVAIKKILWVIVVLFWALILWTLLPF